MGKFLIAGVLVCGMVAGCASEPEKEPGPTVLTPTMPRTPRTPRTPNEQIWTPRAPTTPRTRTTNPSPTTQPGPTSPTSPTSPSSALPAKSATVVMATTVGDITLVLDEERAPISSANFLAHASAGHYDNTVFQRVIPDFVIQGGTHTPELVDKSKVDAAAGKVDVPIKNEWQNGLKNEKGTIGVGREKDPDSGTREFYINVADNPKLDTAREVSGGAGYAVFGRVVDGWDAVETIRMGKTVARPDLSEDGSMNNVPLELVVVKTVRRVD